MAQPVNKITHDSLEERSCVKTSEAAEWDSFLSAMVMTMARERVKNFPW